MEATDLADTSADPFWIRNVDLTGPTRLPVFISQPDPEDIVTTVKFRNSLLQTQRIRWIE